MEFNPKDIRFTPAGIGSLSDDELRAAYEDLAGRAKSELKRISRSKVFGDASVVERNKDYYLPFYNSPFPVFSVTVQVL